MKFTFKHLEYFVATAEHGSIKHAAEKISISPPSISSAISHLEQEFELQLFVRHHPQGLALTSSGKRMMRQAKFLLRQSEELYTTAGEILNDVRGHISVGCMVTLAPMIAPELAISFMKDYPSVHLQIVEGSHMELLAALRQVEVDVAVCYDLDFPDDVIFEPLVSLPPYVLVSEEHPLATRKSVRLQELEGEAMVLLDLPYSRQYFFSLFHNEGLSTHIVAKAKNQELIRSMVANGLGFTLSNVRPKSSITLDGRRVVAVRLKGNHKPMKIGVVTLLQDQKPRILKEFEEHCRKMICAKSIPGMQSSLSAEQ